MKVRLPKIPASAVAVATSALSWFMLMGFLGMAFLIAGVAILAGAGWAFIAAGVLMLFTAALIGRGMKYGVSA